MQRYEDGYYLEVWFEVFGNMVWGVVGPERVLVGGYSS